MLCIFIFLTIVGYGAKVFGSCMFLENYGTKNFGAGVSVYFYLGVGPAMVYFEHGHRDNVMF